MKLLKIGYVAASHGLSGELKVLFFKNRVPSSGDELFFEKGDVFIGPRKVLSAKRHSEGWLIKMKDMGQAGDLRGFSIGMEVRLDSRNAFWIEDITGCDVYTPENILVGRVTDVLRSKTNDLYQITDEKGRELLIPAVKPIVREVDISKKRIVIDPPPGLLEANEKKADEN